MPSRLDAQRDYTNREIENKALLNWFQFSDDVNDAPDLSKSQHAFLLEPHMHGAGCCGWRRYYICRSEKRMLAVYSVRGPDMDSLYIWKPRLYKLSAIPVELVQGKGVSLASFYKWEEEQVRLNAALRAQEAQKSLQEAVQDKPQPSLATIFQTAFASATPAVDDDELDEMLDGLDGVAA